MKRVLLALALLGVPVEASATAANNGTSRSAALVYDIFAGGLHALNLGMALQIDGEHYRVRSNLRTMGPVDVMVRWRSEQDTIGRLVAGKARPALHRRAGEWRLNHRSTELVYDDSGAVDVSIAPPLEEDDRPPVPPELRHGTVDMMSAMLQASLAETPAEACRGPLQIFDGRRRYDMVARMAGEEFLKATRYGSFQGTAMRCEIDLQPIAGFRREGEHDASLGFPEEVTVWLARENATGLVLPVRLQADTTLGNIVVHLTQVAPDHKRQAQRAH